MWAVSTSVGEAAELLHGGCLKQLLGVRTSVANEFAELGCFPLHVCFLQQILRSIEHMHQTILVLSNLQWLASVL